MLRNQSSAEITDWIVMQEYEEERDYQRLRNAMTQALADVVSRLFREKE